MIDKQTHVDPLTTTTEQLAQKIMQAEAIIARYRVDKTLIQDILDFAEETIKTAQETGMGAGYIIQNLIDAARQHGDAYAESEYYVGRSLTIITELERKFMPPISGIEPAFPSETALDIIAAAEERASHQEFERAREFGNGYINPEESKEIAERMQASDVCRALQYEIMSIKNDQVIQRGNTPLPRRIYTK